MDDPGCESRQGLETSLFSKMPTPATGLAQPHSVGVGFSPRVTAVVFSTYPRQATPQRMSGSLPLLLLHAFVAWTTTPLLIRLFLRTHCSHSRCIKLSTKWCPESVGFISHLVTWHLSLLVCVWRPARLWSEEASAPVLSAGSSFVW
jgi:hypothetical protein